LLKNLLPRQDCFATPTLNFLPRLNVATPTITLTNRTSTTPTTQMCQAHIFEHVHIFENWLGTKLPRPKFWHSE